MRARARAEGICRRICIEGGFEGEGDEGITGNRKQTFGFIERGIVG